MTSRLAEHLSIIRESIRLTFDLFYNRTHWAEQPLAATAGQVRECISTLVAASSSSCTVTRGVLLVIAARLDAT